MSMQTEQTERQERFIENIKLDLNIPSARYSFADLTQCRVSPEPSENIRYVVDDIKYFEEKIKDMELEYFDLFGKMTDSKSY